jgi:hypothetical protein
MQHKEAQGHETLRLFASGRQGVADPARGRSGSLCEYFHFHRFNPFTVCMGILVTSIKYTPVLFLAGPGVFQAIQGHRQEIEVRKAGRPESN